MGFLLGIITRKPTPASPEAGLLMRVLQWVKLGLEIQGWGSESIVGSVTVVSIDLGIRCSSEQPIILDHQVTL